MRLKLGNLNAINMNQVEMIIETSKNNFSN